MELQQPTACPCAECRANSTPRQASYRERYRLNMSTRTRSQDADRHSYAIDLYVAHQLRELRKSEKITITKLAAVLGITAREYRRYETRAMPIPVGILFLIGVHFGVPITRFYPDPAKGAKRGHPHPDRSNELLHHFGAVVEPALQRALVETSGFLLPSTDGNGEGRKPGPTLGKVVTLRRKDDVLGSPALDTELSTSWPA